MLFDIEGHNQRFLMIVEGCTGQTSTLYPDLSHDDEGELFVFGSDKDTTSLADEAARRWVNVNLLVD